MRNELFREIFTYGNNFFDIISNSSQDVLNKYGLRKYQILRELKNDPHVWSCIQSRKSGLLALEWSLIPNGANSSIIKTLNNYFYSIDLPQLIRDILEAPLFGFQPFELVWSFNKEKQKVLLPYEIIPKEQELFSFSNDNKIMLNWLKDNLKDIPNQKVIIAGYERAKNNPYGHSLLSKCYYPVNIKKGGVKFWTSFLEKFGSPIVFGHYQRGSTQEEIEKFAESLYEMAQDAVIVAPSDISLDFKEASKSTSSDLFKELIKFCNNEISKAILSQTLTTEIDMGSYAATEIHFKIRKEVILSDARIVESFMNQLIKWIIDINYKINNYPQFNLIINDAENQQRIDRDLKIKQLGYDFSMEYLQNAYGYQSGDLIKKE